MRIPGIVKCSRIDKETQKGINTENNLFYFRICFVRTLLIVLETGSMLMRSDRNHFVIIFILSLLLANFSFSAPADAEGVEWSGSRGVIIVNASGGGDYTHIQWAIDNASDGDTVYVEAGTYYENVVINKTVSLVGAGWENTTIDGQENGDVIHVRANWVNISVFKLINAPFGSSGIHLDGANSCRVADNRIYDNGNGVFLDDSDWNEIRNNVCQINDMRGIILYQSFNNTLQNNTCTESHEGIFLSSSSNNIINMNTCFSNQYDGIELSRSQNNEITNNNCSDNEFYGINIYRSDHNSLRFNNLQRNDRCAIELDHSVDNVLSGNMMVGGAINFYGDLLEYWNTHEIDSSNLVDGRVVVFVKDCIGGELPPNAGQIILAGCRNMRVKDQNISGVITGIQVGFSRDIVIEDNNFSDNRWYGIYLCNSSDIQIRHNRFDSNGHSGIRMYHFSSDNEVIDNSCIGNYRFGIDIYNSNDNRIINNTCSSSNDYGIYVHYSVGNTISGNIADDNHHGIRINEADGTVVRNNLCSSNFLYGISLDAPYCSLDNNTIIGSRAGIYINDNNNNITNNTCIGNQHGIHIDAHSTGNNILDNTCSSNTENGLLIERNSDGNVLDNNIFLENLYGIAIDDSSDDNRLLNNSFIRNTRYGVDISGNSRNNIIIGNIFIENNGDGTQASDYCGGTQWDLNGSGNYWSDRTGPDEDKDGVVDVPYNIDGTSNGKDHYPLVNPSGIRIPVANAGIDIEIDLHETVKFDSSGCGYGYYIVNYTWNFTYNNKSLLLYGPSPTFRFDIPGMYMVTLSVFNSLGQNTNDTMTITVRDILPPMAEAGNDITIDQHEKVTFNASGSTDNIGIISYSWTFFYNELFYTLNGISTDFIFHFAGEYSVELIVIDAEGNSDSDTIIVKVLDITPPVADAGKDIIIRQRKTVYLNGASSYDNIGITNFTWSFIYNSTNTNLYGENVNFTFNTVGSYRISLRVYDAVGNSDMDIINVSVTDTTPPNANAGDDIAINENSTVYFNGSNSWDNVGIVNWTWRFDYNGENVTLYGADPFFLFNTSGKYFVYLYVTDERGNEAMGWLTVMVNEIEDDVEEEENEDDRKPSFEDEETEEKTFPLYSWLAVFIVLFVLIVMVITIRKLSTTGKSDGAEELETERVAVVRDEDDDEGDTELSIHS